MPADADSRDLAAVFLTSSASELVGLRARLLATAELGRPLAAELLAARALTALFQL
jgi:hypothetical protein